MENRKMHENTCLEVSETTHYMKRGYEINENIKFII